MFGKIFGQPEAGGGGGAPHSAPKPASSEGLIQDIQDTSSKLQKQLENYDKQINHLEKQRLQATANLESIASELALAKMQKQQVDALELGLRAVSAMKKTMSVSPGTAVGGASHTEGLVQDTSMELEEQLDIYREQIADFEKQEAQMLVDIKAKMLEGDKRGAMHLFRKKKLLEKRRLLATPILESITSALMQKQLAGALELGLRAVSAVKETVSASPGTAVGGVSYTEGIIQYMLSELQKQLDVHRKKITLLEKQETQLLLDIKAKIRDGDQEGAMHLFREKKLAEGTRLLVTANCAHLKHQVDALELGLHCVDDAEFEDEFAALRAEAFGDVAAVGGAAAAAATPPLPSMPRGVPQASGGSRELTMEEELAALEAAS